MDTLYIVVPCYNEEEVLNETAKRLSDKLTGLIQKQRINSASKILFIDDGSKDNTWEIITQLHNGNKLLSGIRLAHNRGQQAALFAGLMNANEYADMIVSIDADLQDDIDVIESMVDEYYKGSDIIYGVRSSRKSDSFLRKFTAENFYRFMRLLGIEVVFNNSSCRLMSRRAVDALSEYGEVNLFLPGLVPLLGFKNTIVTYERKERYAGKTKYSFKQLFSLAAEAITSFSLKPLRFIAVLSVLFFLICTGLTVCTIIQAITGQFDGWMLVTASIWAVGGALLLSLSIIGEYAGKSYLEVKSRPRYFIDETLFDDSNE